MKRSRFTDSQIIDSVKRVESGIGVPYIRNDAHAPCVLHDLGLPGKNCLIICSWLHSLTGLSLLNSRGDSDINLQFPISSIELWNVTNLGLFHQFRVIGRQFNLLAE